MTWNFDGDGIESINGFEQYGHFNHINSFNHEHGISISLCLLQFPSLQSVVFSVQMFHLPG